MDPEIWPPTPDETEDAKQAFVEALDPDAVYRLASRHNGGRPCRAFRSPAHGSCNVCFFLVFDGDESSRPAKWVVRIPIAPALHDPWAKLQSEVATMRYVKKKTSIPVAAVHGCGRDEPLGVTDNGPLLCAFLIADYIDGTSLDLAAFLGDDAPRQRYLYAQLIDILAQQCQLAFDAGGSLVPDPSGGPEPVVGPLQSAAYSELQRRARGRANLPQGPFRSVSDYVGAQLRLLEAAYHLPSHTTTLGTARMEAFALQDVARCVQDIQAGHDSNQPFVLAHADLRWSNLVVDEDLTIRGVIDWEWAAAVPLSLVTPPTWLAGASPCYVAGLAYERAYAGFFAVLQTKHAKAQRAEAQPGMPSPFLASAAAYATLIDTWTADLPRRPDLQLPLAVLLQHPAHLVPAYYFCVFPRRFGTTTTDLRLDPPALLRRIFARDAAADGPLTRAVQAHRAACDRYAQHLRATHRWVAPPTMPAAVRARLAERDAAHADILAEALQSGDADLARAVRETLLQAAIEPRNMEPVLGGDETVPVGMAAAREKRGQVTE